MKRRDYLKALAALPVAGQITFEPSDKSAVPEALASVRKRRDENDQELVVVMTPSKGRSFDLERRRENAERLADRLAIDGRGETFIVWDDHWLTISNREVMYEYSSLTKEMVVGRVRPRALVVATIGPVQSLPWRLLTMADAWVEMTSDESGEVRLIEWDAFNDSTVLRPAGSVSFG